MTEIRVCQGSVDISKRVNQSLKFGAWHPDSPKNRRTLRIIVDLGNEMDGPGTHWVEERRDTPEQGSVTAQ
jgi:hypothetical protein